MEVIISKQVDDCMEQLKEVLCSRRYGCSKERATLKCDKMSDFLDDLGNINYKPQVCIYKDLGQEFDKDGHPIKLNLYDIPYKDPISKTKWAFGVFIHKNKDKVIIASMKLASLVKEDKTAKNQIVIKDSELRAIINEAIREEIDKLLNGNPQYDFLMS